MNLKYHRIGLDATEYQRDKNGNVLHVPIFSPAKRFESVGFSTIYVANANMDLKNEIHKGDLVYFKANNNRGVNNLGRTMESMGSCEDVAEVFCYYALKALNEAIKDDAVLIPTPYNFAEFLNEDFRNIISKQTYHLVGSSRFYGCISPNVIDENGVILHGNHLLKLVFEDKDSLKTINNNIYSYDSALKIFAREMAKQKTEMYIHPICSRYLANTLFFDYFMANSDRHCKNVNFQKIILPNGENIILPLAILDNGGALALQSRNCEELYTQQTQYLEKNNERFSPTMGFEKYNPFDCQYDFNVGEKCFVNPEMSQLYEKSSYVEQMVLLASQNKVLFNDLKNIYSNLSFDLALDQMRDNNKFPEDYLPNFRKVNKAVLKFKKEEISKAMAKFLGIEFNVELFDNNENYYLDKFELIVEKNALNIHIANNEEINEFNQVLDSLKINFGKNA